MVSCPRCFAVIQPTLDSCSRCGFQPGDSNVGPSLAPLSKGVLVRRSLVLNPPEMQRLSLIFDKVLTFPHTDDEVLGEEAERVEAELEFLAARKVVDRIGVVLPFIDPGLGSGTGTTLSEIVRSRSEIVLDGLAARSMMLPKGVGHAERMRRFTGLMSFRDAPITVHLPEGSITGADEPVTVVEVALGQIPMPPENTPWDEIIRFREEGQAQQKLRSLRQWVRDRATSLTPPSDASDELRDKLEDYEKYMRGTGMHGRVTSLKTWIYVAVDAALALQGVPPVFTSPDFAVDWVVRRIPSVPEERLAPGREVAYISEVQRRFKS
jgi:hypothetical protein